MKRLLTSLAVVALCCTSAALGQAIAVPTPISNARSAFLTAKPNTGFTEIGPLVERVWGRSFSSGVTPSDSVQNFIDAHSMIWGVTPDQLAPIGPFADGRHLVPLMYDAESDLFTFTAVYHSQFVRNIPVFRAHLIGLVRNEPGFPMVLAGSSLRDVSSLIPTLDERAGGVPDPKQYTRRALNHFRSRPELTPAHWVIWAGIDDQVVEPRLAVQFEAMSGTPADPASHLHMLYIVDAADGSVLYQESLIYHADITGSVQGNATTGTAADICNPEVPTGLPYARVTAGATTTHADVNGNFVLPYAGGSPINVTSTITGLYFFVDSASGGELTSTVSVPSGGSVNFLHNSANTAEQDRSQVNAYLHANIVRDLVLVANPAYPTIATQSNFPINVNISATCNATYGNSQINFYLSGGGCPNTAFATVVHHEFGHNVVDKGGSGQGAYGEGMSDCVAVLVTDESVLGYGFQSNCAAGIRNAANSCQYQTTGCSSCGSAVHSCGMLLSGCIWDLRLQLLAKYPADYRTRLASLVVNSVPLHAGLSSITPSITVDFVTLNDDNGDITDGTPDYSNIAAAFGVHNMPAPALAPVKFTFPNGLPSLVSPTGGQTIAVNVTPLTSSPVPGTGKMFLRTGPSGPFTMIPMTQGAPNQYTATFPAITCPNSVAYYFQVDVQAGGSYSNPSAGASTPYTAPVATSVSTLFSDAFETNLGWQYGAPGDTATTGQWVRNIPIGTAAQPGLDHTPDPGVFCAFTGQGSPGGSLGEADIDGGFTNLTSPVFSFAGASDVYFNAWVWYSNDKGANPNTDIMPVWVSNNGGATWVLMQNISNSTTSWVLYSWRLSDYVPLTANMRVRFQAQDLDPGSLVEAALDDVTVVGYGCTVSIPGDLNGDGVVNGADLGLMLANWGGAGVGDLNGDAIVNGADLGILLSNWTL